MRVFKSKPYARFARKARIPEAALLEAIERAEQGLVDADLGGGIINQRIARESGGKSSGFRTIIVFRADSLAFFVYGFAKNEKDTINSGELAAFRLLGSVLLTYGDNELMRAVASGMLTEIKGNE